MLTVTEAEAKQMSKTVEKEKRTWFVPIKDRSKYAKQKIFLEEEFCEQTSTAICAIYDGRRCQKQAFERERDFHTGKIYFSIFRRTKVVSNTLRLRTIHGNSLKEISFWTEMHRSALERLRLKCPGTRTSWCFLWRHWNPFCLKITDWRKVNL